MKKKSTDDLQQELMQETDLKRYLRRNDSCFDRTLFSELMCGIFEKRGMSKAQLAKRSGVSSVYVYQIFSGHRLPSRDKLISLCIGMRAGVDEAQQLLKAAGMAQLYSRCRRDAIIMFALVNGMELLELNEKLYDEGEITLE